MFNIAYECPKTGTKHYLAKPVATRESAEWWLKEFVRRYGLGHLGDLRSYPNGCGYYHYTHARIISA